MKALTTDPEEIRKNFETVTTWDRWYAFVEDYFNWDQAPERSLEQMEADLARGPVKHGGCVWKPFAGNYDVDPTIEFLFEDLSEQAFARLSPSEYARNLEHPDLFGWKCVTCRLYTEKETRTCPFCGRRLLRMPLNA